MAAEVAAQLLRLPAASFSRDSRTHALMVCTLGVGKDFNGRPHAHSSFPHDSLSPETFVLQIPDTAGTP